MGKLSLEQFSVADEVYITDGNKKTFRQKTKELKCLLSNSILVHYSGC